MIHLQTWIQVTVIHNANFFPFNKLQNFFLRNFFVEFFKRVRMLKETGLKVMLALNGYNKLLGGRSARMQFIKHAVKFLNEHDLDGLEINWEYPKSYQV